MYNLRYHVASLVAVFLSLAVGLLLGGVVVERGALETTKTTLVEGLTKDFEQMRTTNEGMRTQLDQSTSFAEQAVPRLIDGALSGRVVLVVADPDRGETVSRIGEGVQLAGGIPVVATFSDAGFGLAKADVKAKVVAVLGTVADADLEKKVAETLAREMTLPAESRPLTNALIESGELTLSGLTPTMTVSAIAVAGAFQDKADAAEVSLAAFWKAQGRPAAGVESTKKPTGVAAAASAAGCSAVDDVDDPLGRLSLVWLLAGKATGYYGVGEGADAAFPSPLFPGS